MGLARLALAALAVGAVVTLLVIGGRALLGLLDAPPEREPAAATGTATEPTGGPTGGPAGGPTGGPTGGPAGEPTGGEATAQAPTVGIECLAETCPLVTVRVPGGDVLQHREMSRGEEVRYFEPELDVVLTDAGTVRVTVNGEPRAQGADGAREAFTVRGPG